MFKMQVVVVFIFVATLGAFGQMPDTTAVPAVAAVAAVPAVPAVAAVAAVPAVAVEPAMQEMPTTLCGRKLVRAYQIVCSLYYEIHREKNSIQSDSLDYDLNNEDVNPWTSRQDALQSRVPWGRNKVLLAGLANECCRKPCNTSEIKNYC